MAYDLCLNVGVPHPDYLLGRDTFRNFKRRGLTPLQWEGWNAYAAHIPLPQDRADFAAAHVRADIRRGAGFKNVDAGKLVPTYGKARQSKTEAELKQEVAAHLAAKPKQQKKARK